MIERNFMQRGRQVVLWELTDVVAFRKGNMPTMSRVPDSIARNVPAAQVRAFRNAGWDFGERGPSDVGEPSVGVLQAKVYLRDGGRLALGTKFITIQFRNDIQQAQANAVLQSYGCHVVERLSFAPGLFRIALDSGARGDALDAADRLNDSGLVNFAEPEFIEEMGQRL